MIDLSSGFALSPEELLQARLSQARKALYNRGQAVVDRAEKNRFPSTSPASAFTPVDAGMSIAGTPVLPPELAEPLDVTGAYMPNPNQKITAFDQGPGPMRLSEAQPEAAPEVPVRKVKTETVPPPSGFNTGADPDWNPWDPMKTPAEKAETQDTADALAGTTGYDPTPFDASPLIDLYKERLSALSDEPKESMKERLARMLINFGSGTYSAASNIKGRARGPGFAESFGGGATNMGLGELEEKTNKEARADKRSERSFSALSDLMKLHLDLQKARDDQRHKAAELAQRGEYYKFLGGKNDDGLAKAVLTALGQGADPQEIIKFLTAVGGADPAMLERLKGLSTGL